MDEGMRMDDTRLFADSWSSSCTRKQMMAKW
jgi:hypothetical protein